MNDSVLAKRLKELREERGYFQKFVADELGIKSNTLSGYENGSRMPDPAMLSKLANLYKVSVDYLLGRTDIPNTNQVNNGDKSFFVSKIATEFPDIDLMFKDMESLTAEEMKEVYEYIKFKKSQKK
ncbi:helix-turn-helix transcriptional regulator [Lysinibacillus sp. KU-BSD001]|uniref:helix-turn-helix domain-containing protein n=1 Tax=Lysinibacillus sp. KU-BSD001 TaxID=3141328 RepID=UPI0036EA449F